MGTAAGSGARAISGGVHRAASESGARGRPPRPWHRIRAGAPPTPAHSGRYPPRGPGGPRNRRSPHAPTSARQARAAAGPAPPATWRTPRCRPRSRPGGPARSRRPPSAAGTSRRRAPRTRPNACRGPAPLRAGTTARTGRIAPAEPAGEAGPRSGPRSRRAGRRRPGRGCARPPTPSGEASGSASPARTPWRGRTPGLRRRGREGGRLRPGHTARRRSPLFRRHSSRISPGSVGGTTPRRTSGSTPVPRAAGEAPAMPTAHSRATRFQSAGCSISTRTARTPAATRCCGALPHGVAPMPSGREASSPSRGTRMRRTASRDTRSCGAAVRGRARAREGRPR